ncbi:MAG: alpha/beta hydrolase [Planctomycetota bacterium]|nr:alpha/beta hydrolase [Planctomycetota bacterium]
MLIHPTPNYRAELRGVKVLAMPRDLKTPPPERLKIQGPLGDLAATLEMPEGTPRAAVLHLHPHPMHGGTRQNNVVRYGALGSLEAGCVALRIDFRGVGQSGGEYDEGIGEVDDAQAAYEYLKQRFPGLPVFLWGFSFGSRVGLNLGIRLRAEVDGYMAVAWPTNIYTWPESDDWPDRLAFLAGTEDEFIDFKGMDRAERNGGVLTIVDGAGHFFPGELHRVRSYTANTLKGWLND